MGDGELPKRPEIPSKDAVFFQKDENGDVLTRGALSVTEIETLDLISEGQIGGLVTGNYPSTLTAGTAGSVGWTTRTFVEYPDPPQAPNAKFLRSIYWNEMPLVSKDNKYNYQSIDVSFSNGSPNGSLVNQSNPELTISRTINERLRSNVVNTSSTYPYTQQVSEQSSAEDNAKYYRIFNKECKAVIVNVRVNSLSETLTPDRAEETSQMESIGVTIAISVEYIIYYRPIFSEEIQTQNYFIVGKNEKIVGKITYGFIKSTRVDFPENFSSDPKFLGWEIKILRKTMDSLTSTIRNQTFIDSLTEVYRDTYTYPNSSIARQRFSAEFFSQLPNRAFEVEGLKVKIPSNYDPVKKSYNELNPEGWSGTFKSGKHYTDNPAWCYYDIITNNRYGLGKFINTQSIDKWSLYEIGKYCDTLVPDGFGGLEPRFTCNLVINSREEAYKVVNDMASIFRGITYYGAGTIYAVQDSPKDPVYQFSNANVENGEFMYSSSSKKVRHSVAMIRYNDRLNFFKPAIEYVEDTDAIRKYGIREIELPAFGSTSRGQANRLGKWALLTENTETETVSFSTGPEAMYLRPGDIVKIYDQYKKSAQNGGRTIDVNHARTDEYTGTRVLLDREISLDNSSLYQFSLLTPTYYYDSSQVSNLSGADYSGIRRPQIQNQTFTGSSASGATGYDGRVRTHIKLPGLFDTGNYTVTGSLIWSIALVSGFNNPTGGITNFNESNQFLDPAIDYYRILSIEEYDNLKFKINGLQNNYAKYTDTEDGLFFKDPLDFPSASPPPPPYNLSVFPEQLSRGSRQIGYSFLYDNYSGISTSRVYASQTLSDLTGQNIPDDSFLIAALPKDLTYSYYTAPTSGNFYFKVLGYNDARGVYSTGSVTGYVSLSGFRPITDVTISSLTLSDQFGNTSPTGTYDSESPTFSWQVGIEPNSSLNTQFNYRISIRNPSTTNIPSSEIFFQTTGYVPINDKPTYNFPLNFNINLTGGPYRNYDVVVEAVDVSGFTSAGNTLSTENGWAANPYGYDILHVQNAPITGTFLSSGQLTHPDYATRQWIDADGTVKILFTSGRIPQKAAGGYIFASTGHFTTGHLYSGTIGYSEIQSFKKDGFVLSSAQNMRHVNTGWMCIGFSDNFDEALRRRYFNVPYQIPVSNIVPIYGSGDLFDLRATHQISIFNTDNLSDNIGIQTVRTGENSKNYFLSKMIDDQGRNIVLSSRVL